MYFCFVNLVFYRERLRGKFMNSPSHDMTTSINACNLQKQTYSKYICDLHCWIYMCYGRRKLDWKKETRRRELERGRKSIHPEVQRTNCATGPSQPRIGTWSVRFWPPSASPINLIID